MALGLFLLYSPHKLEHPDGSWVDQGRRSVNSFRLSTHVHVYASTYTLSLVFFVSSVTLLTFYVLDLSWAKKLE